MDSKLLALIATLAIASTALIGSTTGSNMGTRWEEYKNKYSKTYTASEDAYRFAIYAHNVKEIEETNAKGLAWTAGENQFTDLLESEFLAIYASGYKPGNKKPTAVHTEQKHGSGVNWVTKGKVQKVKNQGQCGSCWAFSTMAAAESADAVLNNHLGDFAEQQLVDCDSSNSGCGGGWPYKADQYLEQAGICEEDSYPYTGVNGTCKISSCTKAAWKMTGYTSVN